MDIIFEKPIYKKSYYVSHTQHNIVYDMTDIQIKRITKLQNKGHILNICTNIENNKFFKDIDDTAIYHLLSNNKDWFDNSLTESDIKNLFQPSYCEQNNCINVVLPNDIDGTKINIYINNKKCLLNDFIDLLQDYKRLKEYIINFQLQHIGMYIYSKQTMNKWAIKTVNIYSNDEPYMDTREDIEIFWKNAVEKCDNVLIDRIHHIENIRKEIQIKMNDIVNEPSVKLWELKINDLNKCLKNIL